MMTIRPFRVDVSKAHRYRIQTHRGDKIANDIKIPKNFWIKLYSYPITAFGYTDGVTLDKKDNINPKFDKKDVIKALDFWIEYFVYQNKCDYILENTVNKDFELHLEELIRVREAVLKDPADTKYVRQKIRPEIKDIIEFTENVLETSNSPYSTVDQFCYKVKTMTRKEYEEYNKPKLYNTDIAQSTLPTDRRLSRILSALIENQNRMAWEEAMNQVPVPTGRRITGTVRTDLQENFRDDGNRWNFGIRENFNPNLWVVTVNPIGGFKIINSIDNSNVATDFTTTEAAQAFIDDARERFLPSVTTAPEINDVSWAGPGIFRIEPQSPIFQLGDRIVWDVDHFRRAISTDLPSQTIRLSTETQTPEFLQWVMTNTITLPDTHHTLNPDEWFDLRNDNEDVIIIHARVGAEQLNPGDTIRLNENREWVRVLNPVDSPNFNPNIPATPIRNIPQRNDFSLVPGELANMIPNRAVGRAGDSLRVGDLIVQDGNGVRWVKAIDPILPHERVMVNMEDKRRGEMVFAREPWQPIYR